MQSGRRLLLINPWIYDFAAYDFWMKPLGLLYVAAVLKAGMDCRLDFIDCLDKTHPGLEKPLRVKPDGRGPLPKETIAKPAVLKNVPRRYSRYGIPVSLFREALKRVPVPDLVLVTCTMTYWYPGVQAVTELVRERFGGVPIVLGGAYASLLPEHARMHSGADIVAEGPGERKIGEIVRSVLGTAFREDPGYRSFEDLPSPEFRLLRDRTWLPVMTSRGCPFRCSFCAGRLLFDGFEGRTPASVIGEIEESWKSFGTRHFAFYDDALFIDKERRLIPILEGIAEKELPLSFHAPNGVHIHEIDEAFARLLKRSGVKSLYLSQESADESLIKERTPKVERGDLEKALSCLENAGYSRKDISVYLIAGLPGQEGKSVLDSVRWVKGLGAVPRLSYFSPIPGTPEWETLVDRGILAADADPLLHNKSAFPYLRGGISPEDLQIIAAAIRS